MLRTEKGSISQEAEALYKDYQKTASSLSAAQKSQKEEAYASRWLWGSVVRYCCLPTVGMSKTSP